MAIRSSRAGSQAFLKEVAAAAQPRPAFN